MDLYDYAFQIAVSVIIFYILINVTLFVKSKLENSSIRIFNPNEYFPEEEVQTLKQVFYLVVIYIILFLIANLFFDNGIVMNNSSELYALNALLDIVISIYLITTVYRKNSVKNYILIFFLFPIASTAFLIFGPSLIEALDLLRIPALLYMVKILYGKFKEYTDKHALSFSIILLLSIIFFSSIITTVVENVSMFDALLMVSNAFTSNGYAILGESIGGKLNSIILVWSGYIISGAATATLTAAILLRYNNHQLIKYDEKLDDLQSSIDELKEKLEKKE